MHWTLDYLSYLEAAAAVAGVPIYRPTSRCTDQAALNGKQSCGVCNRFIATPTAARVLLCSHVICAGCALVAEQSQGILTSSASSGRCCPICKFAQPFPLTLAPVVTSGSSGETLAIDLSALDVDTCRTDKEGTSSDVYVDGCLVDKAHRSTENGVDENEQGLLSSAALSSYDFSGHGFTVGMHVARVVPGFGPVLGTVVELRVDDDTALPLAVVDDHTRAWLEPLACDDSPSEHGSDRNADERPSVAKNGMDLDGGANKDIDSSEISSSHLDPPSKRLRTGGATFSSRGVSTANLILVDAVSGLSLFAGESLASLLQTGGGSLDLGRHQIPAPTQASLSHLNAISRSHARLVCPSDPGSGPIIKDLKSVNGVFVNGVRVTQAALVAGDELVLGGGSDLAIGERKETTKSWPAFSWRILVAAPAAASEDAAAGKGPVGACASDPTNEPSGSFSRTGEDGSDREVAVKDTSGSELGSGSTWRRERMVWDMDELAEEALLARTLTAGTGSRSGNARISGFGSKVDEVVRQLR